MSRAETALRELRQGGRGLERYVEEFIELSHQTQRNVLACPKPRTSTYRVNGLNHQPSPKSPVIFQSSTAVLSPMRPASFPRSNLPATAQSPVS
ncbi:proline-rich receptor kinase PERK2 [Labeo rohita]|uniref:Proline-rich receptor kinase PERK2 n=1 Tax=Labeo rohita TaxID=84645 RepID=A0A498LAR0_LABRO|nr:proline-rich receptor kinase PERK2 [Labeo rohita]